MCMTQQSATLSFVCYSLAVCLSMAVGQQCLWICKDPTEKTSRKNRRQCFHTEGPDLCGVRFLDQLHGLSTARNESRLRFRAYTVFFLSFNICADQDNELETSCNFGSLVETESQSSKQHVLPEFPGLQPNVEIPAAVEAPEKLTHVNTKKQKQKQKQKTF